MRRQPPSRPASMPLSARLFESLWYLVPVADALFALLAVVLARRGAVPAVWVAWLLGPVALTIALSMWVAHGLTPGIIPLHRWLLFFALTLAAPTAVAALAATRLAMRGLAMHALVTLAVFAIAYQLGAIAAGHVVELIQTVQ